MSATRCQTCGTPLPAAADFCGACGHTNLPYKFDERTARTDDGKTRADYYATTPARPEMTDVVERILTVPLDDFVDKGGGPKDAFATVSAPGELMGQPEYTTPPGWEVAPQGEPGDPYSAALRRAEQDALAALPTSPLRLEKDEDDDDEILFLPGRFDGAHAPQRGMHLQPDTLRADHLQPGTLRADHLQATNGVQNPHFQTGGIASAQQGARSAKPAGAASNILIAIGILVVTTVIILSLLPLFQSNTTSDTGPTLALINATSAFPGGSVHLHGSHFTPGSSVIFYLDGVASAQADPSTPAPNNTSAAPAQQTGVGLGVALLTAQVRQSVFTTEATTQADGTFDASITIPQDWQVNTTHNILATERGSGQKALAQVTVVDHTLDPSLPTSTSLPQATSTAQQVGTPTSSGPNPVALPTQSAGPNPTVVPTQGPPQGPAPTAVPPCPQVGSASLTFSAVLGGADPNVQALAISNGPACGAGNWSVTTDAAWLTLDKSGGTLSANGTDSVNVAVSIATLKAGTYSGHIHLSPGTSTTTVSLTIQLPPPCITATTGTLTFRAALAGAAPGQVATIANGANCSPGTWTVASDASWLLVQGGGTINTGASANATVTISTAGLAAGSYSGHLTFSANGSNPATTTVTLIIQSPVCISADTATLNFTSYTTDGANPAPGAITITNCGAVGTVMASAVTGNGSNWLSVSGGGPVAAGGQTRFAVQPLLFTPSGGLLLTPGATYTATITVTITTSDGRTKTLAISVSYTVINGGRITTLS